MDSPAQYVAKLEADLRAAQARVERAERERDEYQAQVHDLAEVKAHMTSAASSAASTAVVAIEHLQKFKEIVDAAAAYYETGFTRDQARLFELVAEHVKTVEARS